MCDGARGNANTKELLQPKHKLFGHQEFQKPSLNTKLEEQLRRKHLWCHSASLYTDAGRKI